MIFKNDMNNVKAFLAGVSLAGLLSIIFGAISSGKLYVTPLESIITSASIGCLLGYYIGISAGEEPSKTGLFIFGMFTCISVYYLFLIKYILNSASILAGFTGFAFSYLSITSGLITERELFKEGFDFMFKKAGSYAFMVYVTDKFIGPILFANTLLRIAAYIIAFILFIVALKVSQ